MMHIWLYTIVSVFVVSMISLIGLFTFSIDMERLRRLLLYLVSFAAGGLLGDAFLHLVPESFKNTLGFLEASLLMLSGIIFFFILEKILWWRHCHVLTSAEHPHPMAISNIVGDSFHNFTDGMIIAGSFLVSGPLGIITTLAVMLHEIPHEIGQFGVLLHAGMTRQRALLFNFMSGLVAVLGAVLTLLVGSALSNLHAYLIPFTVGGFIYIAASDLFPELKKESALGKSAIQLAMVLLGIGFMALMLLVDKA